MDLPGLIAIVAFAAALVVVTIVGARRVAGGDRRFVWAAFATRLVVPLVLFVAGIGLAARSLWIGIALVAVAVVTFMLLLRVILEAMGSPTPEDALGPVDVKEGASPWIDYMIWTTLGVPLLFGAILVLMLITGAFTNAD